MKNKILNFLAVFTFGVVAFAAAPLIYYIMKNALSISTDNISAFGSILGACGAFFAAFVAIYLFNDWREQQRYQNTLQFGLDVYSNFKVLDERFTQIKNELILVQAQYDSAVISNITNALDFFLDKSNEVSKKNLEILFAFNKFHESYVNYLIVTDQENKLEETLPYTSDSIYKFCNLLGQIKFEGGCQKRKNLIDELLSPPFLQIETYIYNYYIKSILIKIRE